MNVGDCSCNLRIRLLSVKMIDTTVMMKRTCMLFFSTASRRPQAWSTYCQPVSGISGRRHLRPADRGHLDFPRVKLASYGGCSFAYAGPSNWNSLPAHPRENSLSLSSFKRHLKTFLFSFYYASRLRNDLYCVEWDVKL